MTDYTGQRFGNYELINLLGKGGFAQVYLGEHIFLKTRAAIKVLDTPLEDGKIEQFRFEAGTIAHLDHPHIVRLLDYGIENETPYLIMDYAPNGTLRQRHPQGMPVPLPTVIRYVQQVADALDYAHQQRIIHRDVKPENLLLNRKNEVVLSDFGIALVARQATPATTEDGVGTVTYVAPEQLRRKTRPASDQYALAVVVYEWLTGAPPFQGSPIEVAMQHLETPPPPMREPGGHISVEVEHVVLRALEKHWQMRFASVRDFAVALQVAHSPHLPFTRVPESPMPDDPLAQADLLGFAPPAAPLLFASAPETPDPRLNNTPPGQAMLNLNQLAAPSTPADPEGRHTTDPAAHLAGSSRPPGAPRPGKRRLKRRTALFALVALLLILILVLGGLVLTTGAMPIASNSGTGAIASQTQEPGQSAAPSPGSSAIPTRKATATPGAAATAGTTPTQTPTGSASPTPTTAAAQLAISPGSLNFPLHLLDCLTTNQPKTLTIQNTGGSELSWQASIQNPAYLSISTSSGSIGPSESGQVSVTASCSLTVGKTDAITFTSNGGNFTVSVTITVSA